MLIIGKSILLIINNTRSIQNPKLLSFILIIHHVLKRRCFLINSQKSDSTFGKLIHETQQGKLAKPIYKVKYYDEKQILNNFEKRCYQAVQTGADGAKINYDDITNGQIDQIAIDKLSDSSELNNKQNDINIDNTLNYLKHLNTITEQIHSEITVTLTKFCHKNHFKLIADDNDYLVIF